MRNPANSRRRLVNVASALLSGLLVVVGAAPVAAQATPTPDARWQAFLGCWTKTLGGPDSRVVGVTQQSHVVCVVPTSTPSAVDIATIENGQVVDRHRVDADGAQHQVAKDGCTGWESAQWSTSNRRVFIRAENMCAGGLTSSASGLLAISVTGEWVDLEGISSGGNKGVRVMRYLDAGDAGSLPAEIASLVRGRRSPAVSAARIAGAGSLTVADIIEASRRLDASVVEAWLVEFSAGGEAKPSGLSARQLADLDAAGVAPSVIDLVVALAYPQVFSLNTATHEGAFRATESGSRSGSMNRGDLAYLPVIGYDTYGYPVYGSDAYMRGGCSVSAYSSYYSPYACSPACAAYIGYAYLSCARYGSAYLGYGYGGYGDGYGYGGAYSGWYPGERPVVVVVRGPQPDGSGAEQPHGKVVKGQGYTQGGSTTSSTPKSSTASGSGSSGGASTSSGSASGAASTGRTAVPKKP